MSQEQHIKSVYSNMCKDENKKREIPKKEEKEQEFTNEEEIEYKKLTKLFGKNLKRNSKNKNMFFTKLKNPQDVTIFQNKVNTEKYNFKSKKAPGGIYSINLTKK